MKNGLPVSGDATIKIWVGTGAAGALLKNAIREESMRRFGRRGNMGNMSRLLIEDFCEKYGYDIHTGKRKKSSPCATPCDSDEK